MNQETQLETLRTEVHKNIVEFQEGRRSFWDIAEKASPVEHYAYWCLYQDGWARMIESALREAEAERTGDKVEWFGQYPPAPYRGTIAETERKVLGANIVDLQEDHRTRVDLKVKLARAKVKLFLVVGSVLVLLIGTLLRIHSSC